MSSFRCSARLAAGLLLGLLQLAVHSDEARLLRFPASHGDQLVFGHAGDLYTVSARGGLPGG